MNLDLLAVVSEKPRAEARGFERFRSVWVL